MRLRLLLKLIILSTCFQSAGQLRTFRNFNHRSGLNYATINCINQSDDGMIWLGTDGGELVKYDGENFEEVTISQKENTHHFNSIQIKGHNLFFSGRYSGFYRYDLASSNLYKFDINSTESGEPRTIIPLDSLNYLIGTKYIYFARGDSIISKQKYSGRITRIYNIIRNDNFAIVSTDNGIYILQQKTFRPLHEWLGSTQSSFNDLLFGYSSNNQIVLYDRQFKRKLEIEVSQNGKVLSKKESDLSAIFSEGEFAISTSHGTKDNTLGILTNKGSVFELAEGKINLITHNYSDPLDHARGIFADYNNDYWVNSSIKGVYKISNEAFTKIQLHPVYTQSNIIFVHKTVFGDVILSNSDGQTFVGNIFFNRDFTAYDFQIHSITQIGEDVVAATDEGLKIFVGGDNSFFKPYLFQGKETMLVYADGNFLYTNIPNEGLYQTSVPNRKSVLIKFPPKLSPSHFYTAQTSYDNKSIYFGTNDGIYIFKKSSGNLSRLPTDKSLGTYCGLSTKDNFGTLWFTLNNGIVGITKSGEFKTIRDPKVLRTNLLYTLSADEYGNLIVGTNKGIILIKVDEHGKVIKYQHFDKNSGFDGYETNMRAQYTDTENKITYVGTVEGLFSINTRLIEEMDVPLAPTIKLSSAYEMNDTIHSGTRQFKIHVNNSKIAVYSYKYRIRGYQDSWKVITSSNMVNFDNISDGEYILEVAASYDGKNYGPIGSHKFIVDLPIWKSNWFVIFILILIIVINVLLINQNKSFKANRILDTKDITINISMTPSIILFGIIAVIITHIFAPLIDDTLQLHLGTTLAVTFALCIIYYFSIQSKEQGVSKYNQLYLIFALSIITAHLFYELYVTKLHPYYIVGIVLTSVIAPYILSKIKHLVIYSLIILFISMIYVVVLNNTVYPKVYFMTAIIILICLSIIVSFLRIDSLEKLIFISGIVNKGNFPAIAFDRNGIVTYASENIAKFMDLTHSELLNRNISILNKFIPYEGGFKEIDVTSEFSDGEKYVVPMKDKDGKVNWIEWSYKDFSNDVKVILGQDISEKLKLENTYELLVQNAEDFIYQCNLKGEFEFLNNVCYDKLGYSKSELIGKPASMIISEDHKAEIFESYINELKNDEKTSAYREFPIVTKDGKEIWIGQYITKTFDSGSTVPNGFIAVARDITNRLSTAKLILEQKESITASINYAKRIQERLLPHERKFKSNFEDHFISYLPKDIVSGDFYWYEKLENQHILALADCTGHGVPGSFMTLLGMNLLNSIIKDRHQVDPGHILNLLNEKLIEVLSDENREKIMDGMEIVLCVIEEGSDQMSFACAGGRFLIYKNDGFSMYKGDNQHIGDSSNPEFKGYRTHYAELLPSDQLILFTDGFQDQFGGENDKKFYFRNLIELFEQNIDKNLSDQKEAIEKAFYAWKGENEQTDDITIISIKKLNL